MGIVCNERFETSAPDEMFFVRVSGLKEKKNEVDVYENECPCDKRISVIRSSMLFVSKKNGSWKSMKLQGKETDSCSIRGIIRKSGR